MNHPPIRLFTFALLILLTAAACSARRVQVISPAREPLSAFSVIEVGEISSNVSDIESQVPVKIRSDIIKEVSALRRFQSVTRQTDETEGVLLLKSTILSYEKGSRAKRYLIGFGTGKSYLTMRCTMINKATGEKIFEGDFEGEMMGGLFGGSSRSTENAVVDELRDYFREKR